jgi:CRISPR-associated endonuclease Csy4
MNRYLDVKIKPDAEMPENWLLNKVYTKLHKAIFDLLATDIGISCAIFFCILVMLIFWRMREIV